MQKKHMQFILLLVCLSFGLLACSLQQVSAPSEEPTDAADQLNLGLKYFEGQGVPQDDAEAAKWYRKAAEQGDSLAQTNLGVMYANGQGVPQDNAEAVRWYRKAVEQGDAGAQPT